MSKDRIKKIKYRLSNVNYGFEQIWREDMEWLIEQVSSDRYREELNSILDYNHVELTIPQEVINSIIRTLEGDSPESRCEYCKKRVSSRNRNVVCSDCGEKMIRTMRG